jgi:gliding motility-associated-like protein
MFTIQINMRLRFIIFFLAYFSTVYIARSQGSCATAVQVSNLTGSPCATAAPQATNTLTPAAGSCVEGTNDTWFYFVAQGGSATVTVSSTVANFNPEFIVLSSSNNNCSGTLTQVTCQDQNGNYATTNTVVNGLTVGTTYWIVVTSGNATTTGTISACVNNPAVVLNCVDNDACIDAATITLNVPIGTASSTAACVNDCNNGANVGLDFVGNGCEDMPNPTVWYEFTTSSNAASIDISLTSTAWSNPEFTIFVGNACTSPWTILECFEGSAGSAVLNNIPIAANTTYTIAVSDASGDQGTFDLCIVQDPDNSACNTTDVLTVTSTSMGSPLAGPYQPGEQVTFCYSITNWTQLNCNYLGAVVPSFGNCWDPSSFNAQGMPVVINTPLAAQGVIQPCGPGPPCAWAACAGTASGSWSWFPAGSATYNVNGYYAAGTPMPAGWYFLSSYNPATGACTGDPTDPDNSFGDGNFPSCGTNTFDYTVCFTLTAGPQGNCGTGLTDCSVSIKTFADGEFGAWNNIGCTADLPVNMPAALVCCTTLVNAGVDQSLCSNGSISLNGSYSNTTGAVTTSWTASPASALSGLSSTTSLNPTFTPPAGLTGPFTFTLSVTDASCTKTDQVSITVNALPTISGTLSSCVNASSQLTGSASPATTNPWTSSNPAVASISSTGLVTAVSAGTTTITYTNSNGCQITATFTVNALPIVSGTLSACVNATSQLTGTATPATTNPWISSNTAVATVSSTGLVTAVAPGTTTITYTNSNGCQRIVTFTVNALPIITGSLSACVNATSQLIGTATAAATNPWISSNTAVASVSSTGLVTALAPGTATITYTNSNGCSTTAIFTVLALPTVSGTLSACVNTTSQLSGSASPSTTSPWTSSNGLVATVSSTGIVTALTAGTTTIMYTNSNGCQITATFTVNALPTISGTLSACVNATSQLSGTASAATTTPWTSSNTAVATVSSTGLVTGVSPGTTTITYTNINGCQRTVTFTVNALPTITGTLSSCVNTTSQLTGTATAATLNPWVSSNTSVATVSSTGLVTAVASGTTTITYTNNNGCQTTVTFTVLALPTISGTLSACVNATSQLSGSASPATTNPWSSSNVSVGTVSSTGLVTGLAAGTSIITYTNSNGCQITGIFTVNALPTVSGILATCVNATSQLTGTATAATTNLWISSNTTVASVSTTGLVTGLVSGTTTITYTNSNGCQSTVTFNVNALPTATISGGNAYCQGVTPNAITVNATGNPLWTVNYTLNGTPSTVNANSNPISLGNSAGTFILTGISDANCSNTISGTQTIVINPAPLITLTSTDPSTCNGTNGSIAVSGSGSGTVSWNGTTSGSQSGVALPYTINGLPSGTYSVSFTNSATGCQSLPTSASLNNPGAPSINIINDTVRCGGSYVLPAISGTSLMMPQYYTLPGGPSGGGTILATGTVFSTIGSTTLYAYDANGACFDQEPFTITINAVPTANISGGATYCANVTPSNITATLTGSANYTLNFTFNGTPLSVSGSSQSINLGNAPGTYVITNVSDANCSSVVNGTQVISVNQLPTATITNGGVYCSGTAANNILVNLTGSPNWNLSYTLNGTPMSISGSSTPISLGNAAGVYSLVTISDNNCANSATGSSSIVINPTPTANISGGGIYCSGINPGNIQVALSGTPTYTLNYTFNGNPFTVTSSSSPISLGNAPGTYTLNTISDNNCSGTASGSQIISLTTLPTATLSGGGTYCVGQTVSPVNVAVTGLSNWTVNYTLNGNPLTQTGTASPINLGTAPGTYTLTSISDAACSNSVSGSSTITVNPLPTASIAGGGNYCTNQSASNILVNVTGTPSWNVNYTLNGVPFTQTGAGTPISLGNASGTYILTSVTDVLCSNIASGSQTIVVNSLPSASITGGGVFCQNQPIETVSVNVIGSGPWTINYTLNGSPNSVTSNTSPISLGSNLGSYNLVGISDLNCTTSASGNASIEVNTLPSATISGGAVYCVGEAVNPIQLNLTGTPNWTVNYTFNGTPQSLTTSNSTFNLGNTAGVYMLIGVSDNQCANIASGTQSIVVNSLPIFSLSPTDPSACNLSDGSILMTGLTPSTSYSLSYFDDGSQISLSVSSNAAGELLISGLNTGIYSNFSITNTSSNCSYSDLSSIILNNPNAPQIDDISDALACDSYTLPAITGSNTSGSASFWTGSLGTGVQYSTGDVITTTDSIYIYDITGNCYSEQVFNIVINATPQITNPGDQQACESFSLPVISGINLTGNEAYYDGSQASGGLSITNSITSNQVVYIYDNIGSCSDEESFLVVVNPLPAITNLSGENEYCEGENISDIIVEVVGISPWTLNYTLNGTTQTINSSSSIINLGNSPGVYELDNLQDANCNDNVDGIQTIVVNPNPIAPITSPDTTYCISWNPIPLNATGSGGSLNWYLDPNLTQPVSNIPSNILGNTVYYVVETSPQGCVGTPASVTITFQNCDIIVPTAFTPDGDEVNDTWQILDLDDVYKNNVVYIYNRWGALIFQSEIGKYNQNQWDGNFKEDPLPVGSYYYIIDFNEEGIEPQKGIVSIVLND